MKVIGESNYFVKPCKTYLLRKKTTKKHVDLAML